jgi:hypothetical protein
MKKLSAYILILAAFSFLNGCAISKTPLSAAAEKGDVSAVKDLLAKGSNACEKGDYGLTPYMWAFESLPDTNACKNEIYRILMDNAYELFTKGGQCPLLLFYAAGGGCDDITKKLLEKGYDPNERYGNLNALSFAAFSGQLETAKILINRGADLDSAIDGLEGHASANLPYLSSPPNRKAYDKANLAVKKLNRLKSGQVEPKTNVAAETTAVPVLGSPIIKSDVDELPAIKAKPNRNAYAILIGIENYRQKLPTADFATQDAKLVADYLIKVMGYPEENVVTLMNDHAALGDFVKYFEKWLPNNVERGSTVFVYYSGHGAPDPKTGGAYLVPYDGDPSFIAETGYSLKRMYNVLGKLPAKEIIVALDSCFSGAGGRSVIAKGARPLVMNLKTAAVPSKNMIVLAASSGDQISSTYDEKGHGLFTYFLLKGIKNEDVVKTDGSIEIKDLFNYIKPQVERVARKQYNNEQSPQLIEAKRN